MRAPIASRKHYNQFTQFTVASGAVTTHVHAKGVKVGTIDTPSEVQEGGVIKAIYLEMWLLGKSTAATSFVMMLEKAGQNIGAPTLSEMSTLDAYQNKKNVFYTTQGLVGDATANPTPVVRQWFKIPKGKQRIGLDDLIRVNVAAIGADDLDGCAFGTYKSYS